MTSHPNFDRTQAALDAARQGDYAPAFDAFTDDVLMENGPGAGPWHRARGKDDLALLLEFTDQRIAIRGCDVRYSARGSVHSKSSILNRAATILRLAIWSWPSRHRP